MMKRGLLVLVIMGIMLLVGIATVARQQTLRLEQMARWGQQSRTTVLAVDAFLRATMDAEAAERGVLLGIAAAPERYRAAVAETRASLLRVELAIDGGAQQRALLVRMRAATETYFEAMDRAVGLSSQQPALALAIARGDNASRWRDEIRDVGTAIIVLEGLGFEERVAASRHARHLTILVCALALILLLLVCAAAVLLLVREFRLRALVTASLRSSQDDLCRSQRRLKSITDNLPATIVGVDTGLCCQYANEQVRRLFDVDPAALVGQSHRNLHDDGSWAVVAPHVEAALRGEKRQFEIRKTIRGISFWMQQSLIPDVDSENRVIGYLAVSFDITDRKRQEDALRKSELLLDRTSKMAGIGGWEADLLESTAVWSEQTCRIIGVSVDHQPSLEGMIDLFSPEARPAFRAALQASMTAGQAWDMELPFMRADGQRIWVRVVGSAELVDGVPVRLVGVLQDISDRVNQRLELDKLAADLDEDRSLLKVTLESIGEAVMTADLQGGITWLNPVAERLTGWASAEVIGMPLAQVFHVVHEETRKPVPEHVMACLEQGRPIAVARQLVLLSRSGEEFSIQDSAAPIHNEVGDVLGIVLVFRDVSEQHRLLSEMSFRASHDALTGLLNRAEFELRLGQSLAKSHEDGSHHAFLYIDLDQFKLVNDACGHTMGDQLLQQVARLLAEAVRGNDALARLGGDEFGILIEHCTVDQAQLVAQKICDRMDDFRFVHEERRFRIGTSIGLVPVDRRWQTTAAIQQAADTSCYAAKEAGRNRVHVWFESDVAVRERQFEMHWATRIEQALDDDGFVLFAQRITPLKDRRVGLHAEVLLRMTQPGGALIAPGAFLPAAERFHLASRIDRCVLRRAIEWMAALPDLTYIELLSVNLSGQSVGDRTFHCWAVDLLEKAGPRVCDALCLEITETAAVTNIANAVTFIDQVRTFGVKVALDDFGAGSSSFGYLKRLTVDILKIDGQFVRDLIDDPLDEVAVRCFADVAQVMGLTTVAEFVDQPAVLHKLKTMGIDFAQGYLLHLPEPLDRLIMPQDITVTNGESA
jgi:diguanylate cyclase (GGDEF)-like protein/PAS domain S-box-containing protein